MNLATLRVRETHGIRRFLYPLTVNLALPDGTDLAALSLTTPDGTPVPLQATHQDTLPRLDFAVFLAPYEQLELTLSASGPQAFVDDPIATDVADGDVWLRTKQKRVTMEMTAMSTLLQITYDGVEHLRAPQTIAKGRASLRSGTGQGHAGRALLSAWHCREGHYHDGTHAQTRAEFTACKSWATVTHTVKQPKASDVLTFTLPLTVTALPLLCDFGVGGGVYGKLGAGDTVTWETRFGEEPPIRLNGTEGSPPTPNNGGAGLNLAPPLLGAGGVSWTLSTNGRTDYAGTVATRDEYHAQQWFHVIDEGKALAVAITHVPDSCSTQTVTLNSAGDVQITFTLGKNGDEDYFGVCYHFLNDAPAIAAATNPQSILLPPTVEVLPAD